MYGSDGHQHRTDSSLYLFTRHKVTPFFLIPSIFLSLSSFLLLISFVCSHSSENEIGLMMGAIGKIFPSSSHRFSYFWLLESALNASLMATIYHKRFLINKKLSNCNFFFFLLAFPALAFSSFYL